MKMRFMAAMAALTIGSVLSSAPRATAQTTEIHVLASDGVKAVLGDLRPQAERAAGHPLSIEFGTTTALKQKIEAGQGFDVAILTTGAIDDLTKEGKLAPGGRADLSRVGIGVGIRAGASKPDIGTPEAMKQALLKAKSITYTGTGASAPFIEKMLVAMGIADAVKAKTVLGQQSDETTASVAEGKSEFVITLISEILPVKGVELLGPLPPQFQSYVGFSAGVGANAKNAAAAAALIKFLSGPTAASVFKAKGMEPHRPS